MNLAAVPVIAGNTFIETIRNKVLYNILIFAALVMALSISFGEWSVFARIQVMEDFGLSSMSIAGLLLAVFIGVAMLGAEVSGRTIYQMATKPVDRAAILTGKFVGLSLTLAVNFALMAAFFLAMLAVIGGHFEAKMLSGVFLIWCEMSVVVAAALFFSTITNPTVSAMLTIAFYIAGRFNDLLDTAVVQSDSPLLMPVLKVLYFVLPNLDHFDLRSQLIYGGAIPPHHVELAAVYALLWVALLLTASCLIFSRKDL